MEVQKCVPLFIPLKESGFIGCCCFVLVISCLIFLLIGFVISMQSFSGPETGVIVVIVLIMLLIIAAVTASCCCWMRWRYRRNANPGVDTVSSVISFQMENTRHSNVENLTYDKPDNGFPGSCPGFPDPQYINVHCGVGDNGKCAESEYYNIAPNGNNTSTNLGNGNFSNIFEPGTLHVSGGLSLPPQSSNEVIGHTDRANNGTVSYLYSNPTKRRLPQTDNQNIVPSNGVGKGDTAASDTAGDDDTTIECIADLGNKPMERKPKQTESKEINTTGDEEETVVKDCSVHSKCTAEHETAVTYAVLKYPTPLSSICDNDDMEIIENDIYNTHEEEMLPNRLSY